jgi:hypothetical protein
MKQSSYWEDNRSSVSQEILSILWTPEFFYLIHNSPSPAPILSHINPVPAPLHVFKIRFNIIRQSKFTLSTWPLALWFPHQKTFCTFSLHHTRYMPCPYHSSWFDHHTYFRGTKDCYFTLLKSLMNSRVQQQIELLPFISLMKQSDGNAERWKLYCTFSKQKMGNK